MSELLDETGISPDFKAIPLHKMAHVEMGQSPDSRYVFEDPFLGYPFLQGNAEFGAISPEPKFGCTRPAKLAEADDVLISVRAPVGAVNIADRAYCIGRGLSAIRMAGVKPSLAAHLIERQSKKLRQVAQGTTFEAINKGDLLALELRMPPAGELPTLAQILDTLDTAIHETEAIIAKLKAVKQGLLHDLLTRGIAVNGELRPPQTEAPHLYKQSPLGWIPKEWDVESLHKIADVIDPQPDHRTPRELENGAPYLGIGDLDDTGSLNVATCKKVVWSALIKQERRFSVDEGDIIFGKIGTIGQPKTLPEGRYALSANVLLLKPKINKSFLLHLLGSTAFEKQILNITNTTSQPALGIETVRLLHVCLAPEKEQKAISSCLDVLVLQLGQERKTLQKMLQEKSGLMDDLLTGRVRVTPLLQTEAQS